MFAQAGIDVTDRLRIDLGARYDAIDTHSEPDGEESAQDSHGIFSPKVGALVKLTDALGVYANVSRGFRATDGVIEDPTLPFITVWAYESGLKLNVGGVSATAALFRMDVSNEQTFNPLTSGSSSGGASRHQGVELATSRADHEVAHAERRLDVQRCALQAADHAARGRSRRKSTRCRASASTTPRSTSALPRSTWAAPGSLVVGAS